MASASPRIALLGFAIECNRFAPVNTREDFAADVDMRGNALLAEARRPAPGLMPDMPGFVSEMDRSGARRPCRCALLRAAGWPVRPALPTDGGVRGRPVPGPFDGVYVSSHGAALTTDSDDPDGVIRADPASSDRTCR